jgi:hypothetical protein
MTQELTYTEVNGYLIPNLALPEGPEYEIGIWGQRRFDYLRQHKSVLFAYLLTSGKLHEHIHEIDIAADERKERIAKQMMEAQGVTEDLKSRDQMLWVGKVNNIYACVDEVIRNELIYT